MTVSLPLLHSPAQIVAALLVAKGLGTDPAGGGAWPVFHAGEPQSPDQVLTVYDTTPKDDGRSQLSGEVFQHYGFQCRIRAATHAAGWAKAAAVRTALDQSVYYAHVTVDGTEYLIEGVSGTNVLTLGKESPSSKRSLFTVNGICPVRRLN